MILVKAIKKNDIQPMKDLIATKESIKNFQELLNRFEVFSGIENMEHYRTVYVPFIESFIARINDLEKSN